MTKLSFRDMYKVLTSSVGTGALISTTAVVGPRGLKYLAPIAGDDSLTFPIRISTVDAAGFPSGDWEVCESVFMFSTLTWSRGTLYNSSTRSRIDFQAGPKHIEVVAPAELLALVPVLTPDGWLGINELSPQEELEITTRPVGGGITITSPRNAPLAGHVYMRHMRGTKAAPLPLQAGDYGGALYYAGIESDGQEQLIAVIYGEYGGDNHGRLVIALNRTPDEAVVISNGSGFGGIGFGLAQGGFEDPIGGVHVFPPASNPALPAGRFHGASGQTAYIVQVKKQDDTLVGGFDAAGRPATLSNTAPSDGELAPGEGRMYVDPTNGAGKFMFKGKTLNGTTFVKQL